MNGKNIVLGVTGSIAAYKAAELVRLFKKRGYDVKVVLTKSGSEFITPLTLETLSKNPVVSDMFVRETPYEVEHISLAKWADAFLVAPATANFLGKYANGIADDFLTTTVMATRAPVIIAPAMNTAMYESPANQANMKTLTERGVYFSEPDEGELACGDTGRGRMADPADIVSFTERILNIKKDLCGKKVLVTAGATIEDIDPVRYITNRSTGKMGAKLARACSERGADVCLVAGESAEAAVPSSVRTIRVRSAEDMCAAVHAEIEGCDIFISAAAPADFTPANYSDKKIKKTTGTDNLILELERTTDILKSVAENKNGRIHIGFAAETDNTEENALKKLSDKNLDAIVLNDVSKPGRGFAADTNAVTWFSANCAPADSGLKQKSEIAHWIIDRILELDGNS